MSVRTIVDSGFDGIVAEIECHTSQGLPGIVIVGFATKAVEESKERIRSAFASLPVEWPRKRITINLAPADVPKEHAAFDLSIAVSILEASNFVPTIDKDMAFFGELGLDGTIRPVRGLVGKLLAAKRYGLNSVLIPEANANQARLLDGLDIYTFKNLHDVYLHLTVGSSRRVVELMDSLPKALKPNGMDFSEVVGQSQAKRALTIAAAGRHNIMLSGPPGTGKTMLAKAFVSILPTMDRQEVLEATHLHSLRGKDYESIVSQRPLRAPHHSASDASIIGGGPGLQPGEISLAHNGVLFLDEFPEFKRNTIEALRQPLEDRVITLSRSKGSVRFPANFILLATANPCPCGYYGTTKPCSCTPAQLQNYRRKLSGPIMDRIDIYVDVENIEHSKLLQEKIGSLSDNDIQRQIILASKRQRKRFGKTRHNSEMTNQEVKQLTKLDSEAKSLLNRGAEKLGLSPRAYMRTIKVARTIADLENNLTITSVHIAEALQYRASFR